MKRPRNERNWWIVLNVDGKETELASGPRTKDGGFTLKVYQRGVADSEWEIPVLTVTGKATPIPVDAGYTLTLTANNQEIRKTYRTK